MSIINQSSGISGFKRTRESGKSEKPGKSEGPKNGSISKHKKIRDVKKSMGKEERRKKRFYVIPVPRLLDPNQNKSEYSKEYNRVMIKLMKNQNDVFLQDWDLDNLNDEQKITLSFLYNNPDFYPKALLDKAGPILEKIEPILTKYSEIMDIELSGELLEKLFSEPTEQMSKLLGSVSYIREAYHNEKNRLTT